MNARARYEEWLSGNVIDEATREELRKIAGDEKEIEDRFYENLEFGTVGLRAAMGAGTNRMNRYTVRMATQGLAYYLLRDQETVFGFADGSFDLKADDASKAAKKVAIAYDSRYHSQEFAVEAAGVLVANGIEVYMFPWLHPTPMLSFAVRYLSCDAGINITGSHNPKDDNGYKVYGPDGSPVDSPMDKEIMKEMHSIERLEACRFVPEEELYGSTLFHIIPDEVDDAFYTVVKRMVQNVILSEVPYVPGAEEISIVYSPLHGTGLVPVTRILKELGFSNVHVVDGQAIQDGDFSSVIRPTPEDPDAFKLAEEKAKRVGADIIIITDPDADRTGIRVLDKETGEYVHFTGNMMGALLTEYVLSMRIRTRTMPENPAVVSSLVITDLVREICKSYGVHCDATGLIGFKYIMKTLRSYEEAGSYNYVFGLEDSNGFLPGDYVRDKDSVGTAALLAAAAAYYHGQGLTLWDQMKKIYEKYGYYCEDLASKELIGKAGKLKIAEMIGTLREMPLKELAGHKAISVTDYRRKAYTDMRTGEEKDAAVESSNMIYYRLEDGAWFLLRPSGTEPTIKLYAGAKGENAEDAAKQVKKLMDAVKEVFG